MADGLTSILRLVAPRSDAHLAAKLAGERALIVKADIAGHLGDGRPGYAQHFTRCLDAGLHEVVLWGYSVTLVEFPIKLPLRKTDTAGHLLHAPSLTRVASKGIRGFRDRGVGGGDGSKNFVALDGSHQSNDMAAFSKERQFLGDEPIRDSLLIEKQFHDMKDRLAGRKHLFVIRAKLICQRAGKQLVVGAPHHIGLVAEAESLVKMGVPQHQLTGAVFGKKGNTRNVFEHSRHLGRVGKLRQKRGAKTMPGTLGR